MLCGFTVSRGPPLLTAMTGRPAAMASRGTMPKCSFAGVYTTALQACSSSSRCWSVKDGRNMTCGQAGVRVTSKQGGLHCAHMSLQVVTIAGQESACRHREQGQHANWQK